MRNHLLVQREDRNIPTGIRFRILSLEPAGDGVHLRSSLNERDTGLQTCQNGQGTRPALCHSIGFESQRDPQFGVRELEIRRQDSDNRIAPSIEHQETCL